MKFNFSIKIRNLKPWKIPEQLNFRFPEGWCFLNSDKTELKRFSKKNSVPERIAGRYWVNYGRKFSPCK